MSDLTASASAGPVPAGPPDRAARAARARFSDPRDLEAFVHELERWERGEIGPEEWKAFRLRHGAYGQRQEGDLYMVRSKLPQGLVTADQLEALAEVAERHSRGFGHVTTRQNLQLHFVTGRGVEAALARLAEAGITSRDACGNTVRNVTACPLGGVSPTELFDTTPYGEALTRHYLGHPLSGALPRKFKVAFEGCAEDHAAAAIHDIGFLARRRDGRRGFEIRVGGGTATYAVSARVLLDFVPAGEILGVAEAVVRVFHRLGERKNRNQARLKWLVKRLGWEGFCAEVAAELDRVRAEGIPPLPFDPERPPAEGPPADDERTPAPAPEVLAARVRAQRPHGPGIHPAAAPSEVTPAATAAWTRTNVRPQRQAGFAVVTVTVPLGDLSSAQLVALAALSRAYADGTVRFTREQDVLLRWVRAGDLPALHARLAAAGLGLGGAGTPADVVSCPGAESCRLAVTHSRGLGRELEAVLRGRPALAEQLGDADIKMSGCPNGCGQHHLAAIGFQGSVRKVGDQAVPQYFVLLGGGVSADGARFGELAAKIPARRVGQALERLAALYQAKRAAGEGARAFFQRLPAAEAKAALADLVALAPGEVTPEDLVDLGEVGSAGGGPGAAAAAAPAEGP
jgi:sulfite reductase beta subunit-like hemoprotein